MLDAEEFIVPLVAAFGSGLAAYLFGRWTAARAAHVLEKANRLSASRWIDVSAYGLTLAFLAAFVVIGLRKFETLSYFGVDFAFFDQALWNSLHGRLLQETLYLDSPTILGHHFSPILLALVPLYAAAESPRVLALLPGITISASVIPLYWYARTQIARPLALVLLGTYFLSPVVQYAALGQFYELDLAVPLLSLALFFLLRQRDIPFLVCLGLALSVKEELAIVALGFGLFVVIVRRRFRLGLGLAAFALLYLVGLLQIVIPHFQGGANYYFFGGSESRVGNNLYGYLGASLPDIVTGIVTRPLAVWQHLAQAPKLEALLRLIVPAGMISLAGPEVLLLAAPILGYILISDAPWVYSFGSWHYAIVIPFIFFGSAVAIRRLSNWPPQRRVQGAPSRVSHRFAARVALGTVCLAASLSYFALTDRDEPASEFGFLVNYQTSEHSRLGMSIAQTIPGNAVLIAQTDLAPWVGERKELYLDLSAPCLGQADYVFIDKRRPWYGYLKDQWDGILASRLFDPPVDQDGYVLSQREAPEHGTNVEFGSVLRLLGYSLHLKGDLAGSQTFDPILQWEALTDSVNGNAISVGLEDAEGHRWAVGRLAPASSGCLAGQLDRGQVESVQYALQLPPTIPAGYYRLVVAVQDPVSGQILPASAGAGESSASGVQLASLHVVKDKSSHTASELQIEQPYFVDMGEMRLLGYVPPPATATPGDPLSVGLYWRARAKPQSDYEVVVQLLDPEGAVALEQAARPANGTYPTTEWAAGEVLLDWHDLTLPKDIAAGDYEIWAALRDTATRHTIGNAKIASLTIEP